MLGCLAFTFVGFCLGTVVIRFHHAEKLQSGQHLQVYQSKQDCLRNNIISLEDSFQENKFPNQSADNEECTMNKYDRQKRPNECDDNYIATKISRKQHKYLNSRKLNNTFLWAFPLSFLTFLGTYIILVCRHG